jgi:GAF domain-containing protein
VTTNDADPADRYAAALDALSQVLVDAPSLRTTLEQLLAVAEAAVPDVSALTVTAITDDGDLTSAASTDDHARAVDEREYAIDEGPCIAALASGEEQLILDTKDEERWPRFTAIARDEGFRSVAGLPLRSPDGTVIGALNVFSVRPQGLVEPDLAVLRRVCLPAAAVLTNARAYRRTNQLSEELAGALEDRAILNRAIGVVLGRHGGTPERAHDVLRALAEREGTSVAEFAARVSAGEDLLGDRDAPA